MSNYPYVPPPPDNIPEGFYPVWNKETEEWTFELLNNTPFSLDGTADI